MVEKLDQLFVILKHWVVGLDFIPDAWRPLISAILSIGPLVAVFGALFAIVTIFERKGLGRIQNRYGPNRVGIPFTNIRLCGFGQFVPDGIKALIKEDVVPRAADKVVHLLAPVVLLIPVLLTYAVLPVGRNMTVADFDAGVLFFFAVGASVELSVFMAGWSSRNKYSLLGAMRGIAQMISYEIPLILSALTVVMTVGSLKTADIVAAQTGYTGFFPNWFVLTPWGFAGFIMFFIASLAESNRAPFDLPEAESEIIAGYFTEYSGFKFALFFLGEYLGMFAVSGLGITLFLGGWNAPFSFLNWVPSYLWFFGKLILIIFVFIWVRGTLPRLRMDQLMNFAWKFMIPMALINVLAAGIWYFMGPGLSRWIVCALLILGPYILLGRGLTENRHLGRRTYRFAD
jgi:NADH-quinone oxidoreductase subunit H